MEDGIGRWLRLGRGHRGNGAQSLGFEHQGQFEQLDHHRLARFHHRSHRLDVRLLQADVPASANCESSSDSTTKSAVARRLLRSCRMCRGRW